MIIEKILNNQQFAATCTKASNFLAFPNWDSYLQCSSNGSPQLTSLSDIWLILAAVIEILLRIATLAAVGVIIYAGIKYSTSQGNPEETGKALNTIISAAVGLVICIFAAVIVTFIAGSFH
jgi:hypothetical protein